MTTYPQGLHPNSLASLAKNRELGTNKKRSLAKINHLTLMYLIKYIMESGEPGISIQALADKTGLHYGTVRIFTSLAHREKIIYIAGWQQDSRGRDAIKLYAWGKRKDAPRFKLTEAERQKRYRDGRKKKAAQTALLFSLSSLGANP